ncbi:MAG: hypothetical protein GY841_03580 [FCB group bacterium]|nr:hypothetical protein [FCB group bacterium]
MAETIAMHDVSDNNPETRFICDDNLGKLARYLRACGFDTYFDDHISDSDLITIALDENRHILTRDHKLTERTLVRKYFQIEDDNWMDQLRAVISYYELRVSKKNIFTRCLEDNVLIETVLKHNIKTLVYPYIYEKHTGFKQCPQCKRVFWAGTHTRAIIERLTLGGIKILD